MHLMPALSPHRPRRPVAGFSLIEVMVTLLVVSVGMLGLAKMQAAAVSESSLSRVRSLMTFQAESLASLMRANRSYWAVTSGTPPQFSVDASGNINNPASTTRNCIVGEAGGTCTAANMTGVDLNIWAANFVAQFRGATVSVACSGGCATPVSYDITLTWSEKSVAINRSTLLGVGDAPQSGSLVLHVLP